MFNYFMMFIVGIDEAGRGPIIGNLFIVCVLIKNEEFLKELKDKKVKDSKQLTKRKREELFELFNNSKDIIYFVEEVKPVEIDEKNLNELEAEKIANLINRSIDYSVKYLGFNEKEEIFKVFVDLPEKKEKFLKRLSKYFNIKTKELIKSKRIELVLEHKADSKYLVVSLASIFAKYLRDKHIDELKEKFGDIGSGYPSDPITKGKLKELVEKEKELNLYFIRKKWKTFSNLVGSEVKKNKTRKLLEFFKK